MKPVPFYKDNVTLAKNQEQYQNLPALSKNGIVTTCWELTWWEYIKLIFTRKIWVNSLTFGAKLQPLRLTIDEAEATHRDEPKADIETNSQFG